MIAYACPTHGTPLAVRPVPGQEPQLVCPEGCAFPLHNGIPRFVAGSNYADAFGLQWNTFRQTQLDSVTGTAITRTRLSRMMGGTIDVAGCTVLEAGCGAGRFTEILLAEGAQVHAVDISSAVEANAANCGSHPGHRVCQADITHLPFTPGQFDVVVCVGVIQHTPDPEATIAALCQQVRPGGQLIIDHYSPAYATTASRQNIREYLLKMPPEFCLSFCQMLLDTLWPMHALLWNNRAHPAFQQLRQQFLEYSPLVDYHDDYSELGPEILRSWALLDTHDTLTDAFKHLRSDTEIATCLAANGMTDIVTAYAGNGVEARARRA